MSLLLKALRAPATGASCGALLLAVSLLGCPPPPEEDKRPEPNFRADVRDGTPPLTVRFTDESIATGGSPIRDWQWDFGDGTFVKMRNPVHTYFTAGAYTVSLTVTSGTGSDTIALREFITVRESTNFAPVGTAGGTVNVGGVGLNIPANVLAGEVVFGAARAEGDILPAPTEETHTVSSIYTITHNSPSDILIGSTLGNAVQPATLTIPFVAEAVPAVDRNAQKLMLIARLDTGLALPIPVRVISGAVVASVTRLPARASYAVIYRPGARTVTARVPTPAKAPTNFSWLNTWQIGLSAELLQQLSALRLGDLNNAATFTQRGFDRTQITVTQDLIEQNIAEVQNTLNGAGLRSPALIANDQAYSLVLFNMGGPAPSGPGAVLEVPYRSHYFGHIVIDPRQLLEVTIRNASDIQNFDAFQVLGFANAFAQELFGAVFQGYDFPRITALSASDLDAQGRPRPIHFLQGLRDGASTFLGQRAGNVAMARSFGPNEAALLSTSLLAPFDAAIPGYAVSGQDFFFYVDKALAPPAIPIDYLGANLPPVRGVLDEIRAAFATLPNGGAATSFGNALETAGIAMARSFQTHLATSLGDAYWAYARDLAIENGPAAMLRPSDASRMPFDLNQDRFAPNAIVRRTLNAPSDTLEISANDIEALRSIDPLSSRVIELNVRPLSTELTLIFNRDEWASDIFGNSLAVAVYRKGAPAVELAPGQDTIRLTDFAEEDDGCLATIYILVSNTSITQANSFAVAATAFGEVLVEETRIITQYIGACDPDFSWRLRTVAAVPGFPLTSHLIKVTTGHWRSDEEVDQTLWQHNLIIYEPDRVDTRSALLFLLGGNTDTSPLASPGFAADFARASNSVVAVLQSTPNQPLRFTGDVGARSDHAIVAYSLDRYLDSFNVGMPDLDAPVLLPMARAAARGMDTVQAYLAQKPRPIVIDGFVLGGASKRAWAAWLCAAADRRVTALIPVAFDALSLDRNFAHHFEVYGFFTKALQEYVTADIPGRLATPAGDSLRRIVDPFEHRRTLTSVPKFILNSASDQFFPPDSSRFYFRQLPGENFIYYAPNIDHSLGNLTNAGDALNGAVAFFNAIVRDIPRPTFTWVLETPGRIVVTPNSPLTRAVLWQATNNGARDFRFESVGAAWLKTELTPEDDGTVIADVPLPATGWTAFFVQLYFPGPVAGVDPDFIFTTPVSVAPDTLPATP